MSVFKRVPYVFALLVFSILILPSIVSAARVTSFDIDRGEDSGAGFWEGITQYWNDAFYGVSKVSFDVSTQRKEFNAAGISESEILINLQRGKIKELEYDFPDVRHEFVRNVSKDFELYSIEIATDDVIGGFWQGLKNWLGWQTRNTLANREYISNVYLNHALSLDLPEQENEVETKERFMLKKPNEIGITTGEMREHYGLDDISFNGSGISIAVLDTGVHLDNEYDSYGSNFFALSGLIGDNSSVDYNGHGSHCSSIIAGRNVSIDGYDFEGMAPGATVYSIKVLNNRGAGTEKDIINGLEMAIDLDVDIISLSLGGRMPAFSAFYDSIQKARAEGIIIVAAAGNERASLSSSPAIWDGVISVGSLSDEGFLSFFSNLNFDVAAIGQDVSAPAYSSGLGRFTWVTMSGTSMACPAVAGMLAVYLEAIPTLKGKATTILNDIDDNGDYTNPDVPDSLFSIATWWNDYYYDFPEIDIAAMFDDEGSDVPSRSNLMTFGSVSFWRVTGKNP